MLVKMIRRFGAYQDGVEYEVSEDVAASLLSTHRAVEVVAEPVKPVKKKAAPATKKKVKK